MNASNAPKGAAGSFGLFFLECARAVALWASFVVVAWVP